MLACWRRTRPPTCRGHAPECAGVRNASLARGSSRFAMGRSPGGGFAPHSTGNRALPRVGGAQRMREARCREVLEQVDECLRLFKEKFGLLLGRTAVRTDWHVLRLRYEHIVMLAVPAETYQIGKSLRPWPSGRSRCFVTGLLILLILYNTVYHLFYASACAGPSETYQI